MSSLLQFLENMQILKVVCELTKVIVCLYQVNQSDQAIEARILDL